MNNILTNLHKVMRSDPLTQELTGAISFSINNLDSRLDDFREQLDIDSATWALDIYEKEYGITADLKKPMDERRSVLKSKMRGGGSLSAAQIKIVADSFTNGNVSVSLNDGIHIEFTSIFGIPANMEDLKKALREITPAHLSLNYTFKYLVYKDIAAKQYSELSTKTYSDLMNGGL